MIATHIEQHSLIFVSFTLNKILFKHMCAISRNHWVSPWRGVGGLCQGAGQPGQAGASHPGRCREPVILPEKWGLNRKNVDFIWIKRGLNGHLMGNGDLTWTTWECKQQYPRGCVWKWEIFPRNFCMEKTVISYKHFRAQYFQTHISDINFRQKVKETSKNVFAREGRQQIDVSFLVFSSQYPSAAYGLAKRQSFVILWPRCQGERQDPADHEHVGQGTP